VRELTLEEKVGQMFMLAFAGDRLDEAQMLIQKHRIGGCYLSHENAQTARSAATLAGKLQDFARSTDHRIPLILGVDQEGTWAVLVPESTTGPGNLALGATFRPDLTESMYAVIGSEMSAVGYNAVLAPCCDVNGPGLATGRRPLGGQALSRTR
jgi:beta-N-acetylhexosaminidase